MKMVPGLIVNTLLNALSPVRRVPVHTFEFGVVEPVNTTWFWHVLVKLPSIGMLGNAAKNPPPPGTTAHVEVAHV